MNVLKEFKRIIEDSRSTDRSVNNEKLFSLATELIQNTDLCVSEDVDGQLWRCVHAQYTSAKRFKNRQKGHVLSELHRHFSSLVETVMSHYGLVSSYRSLSTDAENSRVSFYALALNVRSLVSRLFIYLGDLERYVGTTQSIEQSITLYAFAQGIVPSSGISSGKLAIAYRYKSRTLDALYHYVRSLCAADSTRFAMENAGVILSVPSEEDELIRQYVLIVQASLKGGPVDPVVEAQGAAFVEGVKSLPREQRLQIFASLLAMSVSNIVGNESRVFLSQIVNGVMDKSEDYVAYAYLYVAAYGSFRSELDYKRICEWVDGEQAPLRRSNVMIKEDDYLFPNFKYRQCSPETVYTESAEKGLALKTFLLVEAISIVYDLPRGMKIERSEVCRMSWKE